MQFLAWFAQLFPSVICKACFPPALAIGMHRCCGCTQGHAEFKFREDVLSSTRYELSLIHFLIEQLAKTFQKGDQPGSDGSR